MPIPELTPADLLVGAQLLAPEIALLVTALVVLAVDLALDRSASRRSLQYLALVGVVIAAALAGTLIGTNATAMGGFLVVDDFAIFFKLVFLVATGLVVLSAETFTRRQSEYSGEFYVVLLLATIGLMAMASAAELISLYLALELSALSLAFLAAWSRRELKSTEAGMKFFLLSALSTAVLLYGLALVYGVTGSTHLATIAETLTQEATPALLLALSMVVAGFGFKIAAVPFQMWTPDVYEGSPTPVTAFFATASKAAGFAVLLRVFQTAFPQVEPQWTALIGVLAFLTMTVGNLAALGQVNVKRMLAYSSIGHVGYMLVGFAAATQLGYSSVMFYALVYALTNLAAFGVVAAMSRYAPDDLIESYSGLYHRAPWLSLALALALLSLAGLPPLAGFFSKLYLFWAAAEVGLYWLVVAGVLNSALSLFYYARVIRQMYLVPPPEAAAVEPGVPEAGPVRVSFAPALSVATAAAGIIVLGPISAPFIALALAAAGTIIR